MSRVYNFSAGPAVLPEEVLKEAADEMMDYRGCGMSVMEMSHRSKVYDDIIKTAEADLRSLLSIPDDYEVMFLQGGASQQFTSLPVSGQRKHIRRRRSTVRLTRSHLQRIRLSLTSLIAPICLSAPMQTMFISARTIPSTAPNLRSFPTPRARLWYPT